GQYGRRHRLDLLKNNHDNDHTFSGFARIVGKGGDSTRDRDFLVSMEFFSAFEPLSASGSGILVQPRKGSQHRQGEAVRPKGMASILSSLNERKYFCFSTFALVRAAI
ncbi:hypothetical protein NGA_2105100, partial [Nannochloropsis gaditana CCMP526]|uniref:uncharacterized protein n=1 Tax=Nannochloropsis gaditana (strain CCMP526) TaxID=1093141 RepID=UPI00029F5063